MKPLILVFLALFFITAPAEAQVYLGPIAGGQVSWTKFDNSDHYDAYDVKPVLGYHGGLSISLKVRNRFLLNTSIQYATKGRTIEGKADPLLHNRVRYNYLEMPLIYAVDFRGQVGRKQFKYYLGAGPNISYWLGGKGKLYNSDLDESADYASRDLEYEIVFRKSPDEVSPSEMNVAEPNRFQLGLNVASGIVFEPSARERILFMLRYELGHSFLSRRGNGIFQPTYYEDILQSRNKGLHASVSYLIDLRLQDRKRGKSTIKR